MWLDDWILHSGLGLLVFIALIIFVTIWNGILRFLADPRVNGNDDA